MILDEIDLKILRAFCKLEDDESVSSWKMMKKIYPRGLNREYLRVKRKIERMARYGLFEIDKKNIILNVDRVRYRKIKFYSKPVESICFIDSIDKKWAAFEI